MRGAQLGKRLGGAGKKLFARVAEVERQGDRHRLGSRGQDLQDFTLGAREIGEAVHKHVTHRREGPPEALFQQLARRPKLPLTIV